MTSVHSSEPPPPSPLKGGGGVNFKYHPRRGGLWKILKREWKYSAGAGLLKRGRGAGTFRFLFFQGLSFLHLEITLSFAKLCYVLEEKKIFLLP